MRENFYLSFDIAKIRRILWLRIIFCVFLFN